MPRLDAARTAAFLDEQDYAGLEGRLSLTDLKSLAGFWEELKPMQRLIAFKLLDAPRAMELYGLLPFEEQYFLLCGFPLQAVAPVIEDLPPAQRRPFVTLPRECYEDMAAELIRKGRQREAGAQA